MVDSPYSTIHITRILCIINIRIIPIRAASTWNIITGGTFSAVTLAFVAITVESSKCATDPTRPPHTHTHTCTHTSVDIVYIYIYILLLRMYSYKQPSVSSHVSNLTLWSQKHRLAHNNINIYIIYDVPMLHCSPDSQ